MDVREKLVELLAEKCMATCRERGLNVCSAEHCNKHKEECTGYYADHLIAHGVTVQELDGCEYCRIASYTEKPFTVITQMGREVKTQFNFCPTCGRKLIQPPKGE